MKEGRGAKKWVGTWSFSRGIRVSMLRSTVRRWKKIKRNNESLATCWGYAFFFFFFLNSA